MFVPFKKNRIYFNLKPKKKLHKSVKGQLPYILPDRVGGNQMLEQQKNFNKGKGFDLLRLVSKIYFNS